MITEGTMAPPFTLSASPDEKISLRDFNGKNVVLIFYPADWSPVCGDEIAVFNAATRIFDRYNAQLVGISVDSKWCHNAYKKANNIHFPLLADFEPKGKVASDYGVYLEREGTAGRALFLVDQKGAVQYSYLSPIDINPGADGVLNRLEELNKAITV
jgi:peroxiredoxin